MPAAEQAAEDQAAAEQAGAAATTRGVSADEGEEEDVSDFSHVLRSFLDEIKET